MTDSRTIDPAQLEHVYKAIARGLDHEALVMNHRITWAIVYSAGLFAASAIFINVILQFRGVPLAVGMILLIISGISATGIYFSWTTRGGVIAAQNQFSYLYKLYFQSEEQFLAAGYPRPFGDPHAHRTGNYAAMVFPYIMLISWTSAFALEFCIGWLVTGSNAASLVTELLKAVPTPGG